MGRLLGALAGIAAWLGWLTICPALGFPTLATAAMLNRVFVPRDDPGSWLGWALLLIGLASAALVYLAAAGRGRLRPSIASGAVYGALCWLVAGAIVMPLLGLVAASPAATTPAALTPPDPMHGSFMMLNIGIAAPIAALIAWLMFGAVVGATSAWRPSYPSVGQLVASARGRTDDPRAPRRLVLGATMSIVAIAAVGLVVVRLNALPASQSVTTTQTLATEQVKAMPVGLDFFSIIELSQAPGATLGPHAHPYSGFAFSLKGVATIAFVGGQTTQVAPGDVGFIGLQAAHSHENANDRLPSAVLALLIVALAAVVCLIWLRSNRRDGRLFPIALVLLIAVGALGTANPWSNDWLFLSVRGVSGRGASMPLPTSSRTYESPNIGPLVAGPYTETIDEITVAPGGSAADVGSVEDAVLIVLDGHVAVQPAGGSSIQLGVHGSTVLQPGTSVQVTNAGDQPAHLLEFAITPMPPGA
jgi:quercetin dioxygenase-like cupin family protein